MNKTLIPLLETFSDKEWKSFGKHLQGEYAADSKVLKLFHYFLGNRNKMQDMHDLSSIQERDFTEISQAGFTKLVSKLFIECERFLICDSVLSKKNKADLLLNEIYNSRGLFNLADRKASKLAKHLNEKKEYSLMDQRLLTQLQHQQCYSDNPIKYDTGSNLQRELFTNYLQTVLQQSLVYLCEAHNWSKITKEDFDHEINTLRQITALLPHDELSQLLNSLVKVISDLDVVSFLGIRKELYDGKLEIGSEIHTIITLYLINACIKLWRKGTYVDANENAKLIEYGMATGALFSCGKIPVTRFLNLLSTLGKLKTHRWNEEFIDRWVNRVETKSFESTLALSKALNAFNFGKYELIYDLVRNIEFENFSEKLRVLGLEMIALYVDRKGNYGLLRNFITNYKRTLKRAKDKISSANARAYLNLVKVIELLVQKDFRRLTINLDKFQPIAYRTWVTEEVGRR